jgi:hypothetical protein
MVRPPFHFLGVTSKSQPWRLPALPARFSKAAIFPCSQPKCPACKRVKFDFAALVFHVRLKFMVGSSLKESLRRLDDGEDCGLEWGWKFFPSRDYLGQFGA